MREYLELLNDVMENGKQRGDRTGTGTVSMFGTQTRYDMSRRFPLLTTKKLFTKGIIHELLWMISGDTNTGYLNENGVHIWDDWADEYGDLGPIYGSQWRRWYCGPRFNSADTRVENWRYDTLNEKYYVDQLGDVVKSLKYDPFSRRHIVNAWNPREVKEMALPPCHMFFQFYVEEMSRQERLQAHTCREYSHLIKTEGIESAHKTRMVPSESELDKMGFPTHSLSCHMYQRSADLFLGVPFNIASYSLLTAMVAQVTGLYAKEFVHSIGDAHIYLNHFEQVEEQLRRQPYFGDQPMLHLNPDVTDIDSFTYEDITFQEYVARPLISAPISV